MNATSSESGVALSVLTPPGRGAVAVIAIAGPQAAGAVDQFFRARNRKLLGDQILGRIVYGHWGSEQGEDLVVCRRGVELFEIHCHGGSQSISRIVADLATCGCREIDWREWNKPPRLEAAAREALAQAVSLRTATILLEQFQGALRREIESVRAALERNECSAATEKLQSLLASSNLGLHLVQPWKVVVAGHPNVGKSSLVNALVGYQRSITFDQPGTTRDVVSSVTVLEGWPIELSDTAGLHATSDALESAGIDLARTKLAAADLVIWVRDATSEPRSESVDCWAECAVELSSTPLLVINKCDLVTRAWSVPPAAIATSAITKQGIEALQAAIVARLVPEVPPTGSAIPFTRWQVHELRSVCEAIQADEKAVALNSLTALLQC